jgi:UPF0716 protein FxsA
MMRLPVLPLLLLPFLELWLMIVIGGEVGALAVIAWLVGMILVGVNLLRYLGASSMLRAAQGMQNGGPMPGESLIDGLFKAIGAVLLIIPGFITDAFALLCFIPWVRRWVLKRWMAKVAASSQAFGANPFASAGFRRTYGRSQAGNVYEHQGSFHEPAESANDPVLIDQQPETSAKNTDKRSDSTDADPKNP